MHHPLASTVTDAGVSNAPISYPVNHAVGRGKRRLLRLFEPRNDSLLYRGGGGSVSDWRRAVAVVSERERYARPRGPRKFALANFWGEPESRLGAEPPPPL